MKVIRVTLMIILATFIFINISVATEYTWQSNHPSHLWADDYAGQNGPEYGSFRTEALTFDDDWEILGNTERKYNEIDYCVGVIRYLTMAQDRDDPIDPYNPTEGWAYGYYATKKPTDQGFVCKDEIAGYILIDICIINGTFRSKKRELRFMNASTEVALGQTHFSQLADNVIG